MQVEILPAARELAAESVLIEARASSLVIQTEHDYAAAAVELRDVKSKMQKLDELRFSITRPIDEAKTRIMDFFREPRARLEASERSFKRALGAYDAEQQRIRAEQQRRADEAARKERERLAELQRVAEVRAREQAAEARRQADELAAAGRAVEAEKQLAKAERVEDRAADSAAQIEQQRVAVVAPLVAPATPKVAGVSTRQRWKYRVVDPLKIPRQFLMIDETKLRKHVENMKDDHGVAGIEAYPETVIAARS